MFNITVIGGGIIGLSTARELLLRGVKHVAVLEAEHAVAQHQSGRNSGVVHAGLYYKPGSLKAKLCVEGMRRSYQYFEEKNIPYRKVGKLIVALDETEIPRLKQIYNNALENKVPNVSLLHSLGDIQKIEPECAGVAAIHSPETGIVDWGLVSRQIANDVEDMGGKVLLGHEVVGLNPGSPAELIVKTKSKGGEEHLKTLSSQKVVSCAGTYADRVSRMSGGGRSPQIIPIRGEYLVVSNKELAKSLRGNIYPVPDPNMPFLGVHFTPTMHGDVIVGPNAVLAFARDGYSYTNVKLQDLLETLTYAGFWRLAAKNFRYAMEETYRSVFTTAAANRARRYVPRLSTSDFGLAKNRNGIRGQAVSSSGHLVHDFVFEMDNSCSILHTRNAPSPGATSSLAIANIIADRILSI